MDPDQVPSGDRPVLTYAAEAGHLEIVRLLAEPGAGLGLNITVGLCWVASGPTEADRSSALSHTPTHHRQLQATWMFWAVVQRDGGDASLLGRLVAQPPSGVEVASIVGRM